MNPTELTTKTKVTYGWWTWEGWYQKDNTVEWRWAKTCWDDYESPEEAEEEIKKGPRDRFGIAYAFFSGKIRKLVKTTITEESCGEPIQAPPYEDS